jgi:hypothetical protein
LGHSNEGMDIMVDPKNQQFVGVHGDEQLGILYEPA